MLVHVPAHCWYTWSRTAVVSETQRHIIKDTASLRVLQILFVVAGRSLLNCPSWGRAYLTRPYFPHLRGRSHGLPGGFQEGLGSYRPVSYDQTTGKCNTHQVPQTLIDHHRFDWVRDEQRQYALVEAKLTTTSKFNYSSEPATVFSPVKYWQEDSWWNLRVTDAGNGCCDYFVDEVSQRTSCFNIFWCLKIGSDIFEVGKYQTSTFFDTTLSSKARDRDALQTITISQALQIMRNYLRGARTIETMLCETRSKVYNYGHEDDCFWFMRRYLFRFDAWEGILHDNTTRRAAQRYSFYKIFRHGGVSGPWRWPKLPINYRVRIRNKHFGWFP